MDTPEEIEGDGHPESTDVDGKNDQDPLLTAFVKAVDETVGLEFSVTLAIGGLLVSGMLTSHREYFGAPEVNVGALQVLGV